MSVLELQAAITARFFAQKTLPFGSPQSIDSQSGSLSRFRRPESDVLGQPRQGVMGNHALSSSDTVGL
jgi:hypothetical protein